MKQLKLLLMALTLLIGSVSAHAQFRYGPELGANFYSLSFKQPLVATSQAIGPSAMLRCEFIFTSFGVGIDFGLGYSMTGGKADLGQRPIWGLDGFGNVRSSIHNLHIPVHIRFKWTKMHGVEEIVAPIVYGGPEFNIQLGHSPNRSNDVDAYKYSGGDFALGCGAGVELFRHWQITAGYSWGMTYALKTRLLDDFSARSSGWNLRVAYMF